MTDIDIAISMLNSHDMYEEAEKLKEIVNDCNCYACRIFKNQNKTGATTKKGN